MSTRRGFLLGGLAVVAAGPVLTACGSDGAAPAVATGSPSGSSSAGPEEGAFPVTIRHKYGATTIESAPQRVVCIGYTEQDALLALGIVPVGVTYWFGDESLRGVYPWARDLLGDAEPPVLLKDADGVEIEKIAALAPDLIIGQYTGLKESDYEKLSALAPVVAQSGDYADYGMPWDEMALNVGAAVGRPQAAQALVDEVKARIAEEATAHPEFAGQTAAVITPWEGLFLYGPEDPRSRMLVDLGFTLHPLLTDADDNEFGVSVSAERTSDLGDIGTAVWIDLNADPQVAEIFAGSPAYDEGRWVDITDADGSYYVAHSFVTPLSIPYLLDRYVPQLVAAADGDPSTKPPAAKA